MKTKLKPPICEYLASLAIDRRERLKNIIRLIVSMYPDANQSMSYKMPTFKYGNHGWVAVASQKHYVSIYTCGHKHLESFKKKYPYIKTGKGCINMKDVDQIKLTDLRPVIKSAMSSR